MTEGFWTKEIQSKKEFCVLRDELMSYLPKEAKTEEVDRILTSLYKLAVIDSVNKKKEEGGGSCLYATEKINQRTV